MKKRIYRCLFGFLPGLLFFSSTPVCAAQLQPEPYDTVFYDTSFAGIGPEVYNLPAPRTRQELLTEQYEKKQAEAPLIISMLDQQQFYNSLRELMPPAAPHPPYTAETLLSLVNTHRYAGNVSESANAQNDLAILLVRKNEIARAEQLFKEALAEKQKTRDLRSALIIVNNLALLSQHTDNPSAASGYYLQAEELAKNLRDKTAQANALIGIAIEQAKQKRYDEAERIIIRKAIPLFKSAHNQSGHIDAFKSLAMIYEMQQKYAQASWFYLQAKHLASPLSTRSAEMAYILFNLGHIKNITGDSQLAVLDFKIAENIARENNLLKLQLEIQDVLGNIYHQAGDYTAAVLALNEYNNLKGKLMVLQNMERTGI